MTLFDGAAQIGSGSLVGGSFAVTTAAMPVANHAITAVYAGDGNFLPSASAALNQVVNRAPTTVGMVANPSGPATFGTPVTFTATVSVPAAGAGTPTGPVVFAVDGTNVQTTNLNAAMKAAVTTSILGIGSHVITATYQGDGNFLPSSNTLPYQTVCTVTITGAQSGAVNVSSGSTCLVNASIKGAIVVKPGASLNLENSTVGGSIVANQTPGTIRICGSTIAGSTQAAGAQGLVIIGDPGDANCAVNTIGGVLVLKNNTHGVEAINNTLGSLNASNNSGPGPYPGDTTTISGNHS